MAPGIVCSTCGEENLPDAQFCASCRTYLGWQDDPPAQATPPAPAPVAPVPAPVAPESAVTASSGTAPVADTDAAQHRFEADIAAPEATVPVDGTPTTMTVNVANTSSVVDGYVVEAIDAPAWLSVTSGTEELLPGTQGTVEAALRIESSVLVPAQQVSLGLRVRNTTRLPDSRDFEVRVTVPVVDAPFEVRAEPALLRARDHAPPVCAVVVSNARSNQWAQVQLSAADSEDVVRPTFASPQLRVPPGGEARTDVRFEAPTPGPGAEVSRTITVTAADGQRRATTTLTLVQATSRAAVELLVVTLEPSVLRLGGARRGRMTATLDNRRGTAPVQVSLRGDDPEQSLAFTFSPTTLQVPAGTMTSVGVDVRAARTPPGQEVTRSLTVVASDGQSEARADGSVIQQASSRRGLARVLLTVLGGLVMLLGTTLPFSTSSTLSALELTASEIANTLELGTLDAGGFEDVVSLGLVLLVLAVLMVFGLAGKSGRLTRRSAVMGVLVVAGAGVGLLVRDGSVRPEAGALLIIVGCVLGYVGGLLGRR